MYNPYLQSTLEEDFLSCLRNGKAVSAFVSCMAFDTEDKHLTGYEEPVRAALRHFGHCKASGTLARGVGRAVSLMFSCSDRPGGAEVVFIDGNDERAEEINACIASARNAGLSGDAEGVKEAMQKALSLMVGYATIGEALYMANRLHGWAGWSKDNV